MADAMRERRDAGIKPENDEMEDGLNAEGLTLANPQIVKVQYYSETTEELSPREYTYYSADPLKVGDIVIVPVRDTTGKAKVSAIDVTESEIAAFRDKVKTIPAGAAIQAFVESNDNAPYLQDIGDDLPYVMPEETRGARVSNPRFVDDIADKLQEPERETAVALRPGEDIEAQIEVVALARQEKAYYDEAIRELKVVWETHNKEILEEAAVNRESLNTAESLLRELTIEAYNLTGNKSPAPGVSVKIFQTLDYDSREALKWAMAHQIALSLDKKSFETFAKATPLEFVTIGEESRVQIAQNLGNTKSP